MSAARRLAGPAALVATAGGLAAIGIHDELAASALFACSAVVAAAGVGLAHRSMIAQVLSRAIGWLVLVPTTAAALLVHNHDAKWAAAALAVGSGSALLLARPMLQTPHALATFAPTSFRNWLIAGATASAATGMVASTLALDSFRWDVSALGIARMVLSLAFLGATLGVLRMRAWGILLGAFTSVVALVSMLVLTLLGYPSGALLFAAVPGLMFALPVLVARSQRATAVSLDTMVPARVAVTSTDEARVRIASAGDLDVLDDANDLDVRDEARAARVHV